MGTRKKTKRPETLMEMSRVVTVADDLLAIMAVVYRGREDVGVETVRQALQVLASGFDEPGRPGLAGGPGPEVVSEVRVVKTAPTVVFNHDHLISGCDDTIAELRAGLRAAAAAGPPYPRDLVDAAEREIAAMARRRQLLIADRDEFTGDDDEKGGD
jgi:hypothetical protein